MIDVLAPFGALLLGVTIALAVGVYTGHVVIRVRRRDDDDL